MATKVFISWSGDLSNKLADAISQWLPKTLQFVKPYFTPSDIEKGARWESEILSELSSSDIGIICLTNNNLNEPWLLFESGALSKNLEKARVCSLLFGVQTTELTGPLTIFQSTRFEKADFAKLLKTINSAGRDAKLDDSVLESVFEMWWPKLEESVSKILNNQKDSAEVSQRTERDILEEILELARLRTRSRDREFGISPRTIIDLIEIAMNIPLSFAEGDIEKARKLAGELHQPISQICRYSPYPNIIERYQMYRNRLHSLDDEENIEEKP